MRLCIPYLRSPVFRRGPLARYGHEAKERLSAVETCVLDRLIAADADLDDLVLEVASAEPSRTPEEIRRRLEVEYSQPKNLVGLVNLDLDDSYDIVAIDQGYGGVYVHTVELVEKLRRRYRVLLISPEDPLFLDSRHKDDLTVPRLKEQDPTLQYFSFIQIVRAVLAKIPCRLLFIAHRTQSLFLFDRIARQPTIIYCDGYFDGAFKMAQDFGLSMDREASLEALEELHYMIGSGTPDFFGFLAGPNVNLHILNAGHQALAHARENWCWGREQAVNFQRCFPELGHSLRFEPPFTDPALFDRTRVERERVVLFTTTMHNIEKKGLPELVKAMEDLPELQVRCVVRQPDKLPPIPPAVRVRMTIGPVKKPEMVDIYHRVWLNCRVSREESSPLSILEAMSCEIPQVTSSVVAAQIPIIEDGKTGFVLDPDDRKGQVRALRVLMEDPALRDRMGTECRRRALEYSLDRRWKAFEAWLS